MAYLSDYEKRILFSALARDKEVCKEIDKDSLSKEIPLTPIVESLERKFYYDRFEKEIKNKAVDDFARRLIINFVDWQMSLAEVGNEKEYETIKQAIEGIEEIAKQMKGEQI